MEDIKALSLIREIIDDVKGVSNPPKESQDETELDVFANKCFAVINHALATIIQVPEYAKEIVMHLEELRLILNNSTKLFQERLIEMLNSISTARGTGESKMSVDSKEKNDAGRIISSDMKTVQNEPYKSKEVGHLDAKRMKLALQLQEIEVVKQNIQESIVLTQIVLNDVDNGMGAKTNDVENLKDSINGWMAAAKEQTKEDQNKRDEIKQKSEKEEQQMHDEDERRIRIKEEQEQQEQDQRRIQRAEEERLRKEEEDRKSKDEEEKRLKEEDERRQREDEEISRRKEEAEERKLHDQERQEREEERFRKEEEERKRIEEDKLKRDPANWEQIKYDRHDETNTTFHNGVCCVVAVMDGTLEKDDLECLASDEWREDDKTSVLNVDEKLASSIIRINSKSGEKTFPVPMRVYAPHCSISDSSDEIVVKVSIDDGEWTMQRPVSLSPAQIGQLGLNYAGIDVCKFKTVKMVAVAKTRSQEFVVNHGGTNQISNVNKNVKLFVPKDTFSKPCKLKLEVRQMKDRNLLFATQYYEHCHNVLSTSSVMKITSESTTNKSIELSWTRNTWNGKTSRENGKYIPVYKCRGDSWKLADIKGRNKDVSVTLPSRNENFLVMEIEGRQTMPTEEFLKAADEIYLHSNASIVQVIAKQSVNNDKSIKIECIERERVELRISELEIEGYSLGPDTSREFSLLDGQSITLKCSGNINMEKLSEVKLTFYSYMDTAKHRVDLQVVDEFKQKDSNAYFGTLEFEVMADKRDRTFFNRLKGSLPLTLRKEARKQKREGRIQVHFPHDLTALVKFLAIRLTTQTDEGTWLQVIYSLDYRPDMRAIRRRAVLKFGKPVNDRIICEFIFFDWMKHKLVCEDKAELIIEALMNCQMEKLANECKQFVNIQRKHLSDSRMSEMARLMEGNWESLSLTLGLSKEEIDMSERVEGHSNEEMLKIVLCNWRVSEVAITRGVDVFNDLLGRLETEQSNMELKEYIRHVMSQIN